MAAIAWPLSTSPGLKPQEGSGRLINVFAEPRGEDEGPVWRRAPGVSLFAETDEDVFRGGLQVSNTALLAAFEDAIVRLNYTGSLQGQAIPPGGTNIGDMTGDGGLAAAFDATTNQAVAACATLDAETEAWVGKELAAPSTVFSAIVYGSNDAGYVSGANPDVTLELYGQTGDEPIGPTDGTLLGTLTFTDTADESGSPRTVTSDDTATEWDYLWIRITHDGSAAKISCAELQLYSPTMVTVTDVDTLSGTDRIDIFKNNAATPDIAIVCEDGPFVYDPGDGDLDDYPDGDVGSPTCGCSHLGWFIFGYGNGDIRASGVNSTAINTLDRARTESNPDGVIRVWSYEGNLWVAGDVTIEVWGDPVNDTGFPLSRRGFNIIPGLKGASCVAGFEPEFGNPPIYIASDNSVRWMRGYTPEKISPPDLDRLIAGCEADEVECFCYLVGGHPFWQVNGPTFSWVFAVNSMTWHERHSYLRTKSRLLRSVFAFNTWLVGDDEGGNLGEVDHSLHKEFGNPLVARAESMPVLDFPNRVRVARADFNMVVGVGDTVGEDPIETDPTLEISWSDDGGYSWSNPWQRKLGRQAITTQRIILNNTGLSGPQGRRWRLTLSDPVHFGLMGGDMTAEVRAR